MVARSKANIRLHEACAQYLDRIKNEGQTETSVRTASYALSRFKKAVGSQREPNPYLHLITPADADDYCYGPGGVRRDIRAVSFNRHRSVLVCFFEYALMMRWVDQNVFDGIGRARPDTPRTRLMLNATEMLEMLERSSNPCERVALALGMNTGLRANDIRHLTIFDASLAGGVIQTEIRKTRKLDIKPITTELHNELIRWLDIYATYMDLTSRADLPNEWLLVPSYRNPTPAEIDHRIHLRPTQMHTHPWRMVQRPLARMGYPTTGEGFHTLRRSSARALFESLRTSGEARDHALMVVQAFLNHADTRQTQHYLGLDQERTIRDALLKDQPFLTRLAQAEQARVQTPTEILRGA